MITKLSLLAALTVLFAMPCKAQQDTGKNKGNAIVIHFAMDTTHHLKTNNYRGVWVFNVSTDLAQDAFFQPNIGTDIKISRLFSLGANMGYVIPSPLFRVNPLANGQFTDPGTVYRGLTLRLGLKFYYNENRPGNYIGLQAVYKYLIIADEQMEDDYGDEAGNTYEISEKTNTLGGDVIIGFNTGGDNSKVCMDLFFGFGVHVRIRNYTIFNDNSFGLPYNPPGSPYYGTPTEFEGQPIAYNGTYNVVTPIVAVVVGAKLVYKHYKKAN